MTPERASTLPRVRRATLGGRMVVILGTAVYVALLTAIYVFHISPSYSYLGYVHRPVPAGYLLLAWLAAWLPSLWMPVRLERPSQVVYWLLFVLVYVPSTFVPFLSLEATPMSLLPLLGALTLLFALLGTTYLIPRLSLTRLALPPSVFWFLVGAATAALALVVASSFGVRFQLPSLLDVYDVRAEFKQAAPDRLANYSTSWLGNTLFPFLMAVGLIERRAWLLASGAIGQLFIYSITGFKSVLFSGGLLVVLLIALRARGRFFGAIVAWGAGAAVAGAWLIDIITRTPVASSLFVRRVILTPGILTGWYYDYFSQHPKALLGHSVLEGLTPYPYDRPPPLLIGREYFGRDETYANANIWADAFSNFGFPGMLAFTLVLMGFLWLFDSLVHKRGWRHVKLASLVLGIPAFTLSNTALITSLLMHGAALAWLVLYFAPKGILERNRRAERHRGRRAGGRYGHQH